MTKLETKLTIPERKKLIINDSIVLDENNMYNALSSILIFITVVALMMIAVAVQNISHDLMRLL